MLQLSEDGGIFYPCQTAHASKESIAGGTYPTIYQRVLDERGTIPTILTWHTYDVPGWNRAARLVIANFGQIPESERNISWLLFSQSPFRNQITLFKDMEHDAQEVLETFGGESVSLSLIPPSRRLSCASNKSRVPYPRYKYAPLVPSFGTFLGIYSWWKRSRLFTQ